MREFQHFPQDKDVCPICKTNHDEPYILMPIDGTQEDNICEAMPVHTACFSKQADRFRINRDANIIYLTP